MTSAYEKALAYANEDLAASAKNVPDGEGQFVKGLRSGTYGMGSSLRNAVGAVGGALGADEFAAGQYQEADRLAQLAGESGPRVTSYKDVNGLRDAYDYGVGILGQTVPSAAIGIIPGLGAATTAGRLGAATLAYTPMEMGDTVAKMRAAGQEVDAGRALGTGLVSAGAQSIVPAMVGGKIVGQGAKAATNQSFKQIVGKNIIGDGLMEGVAEGGSEAFKQLGANPNAAIDWDQVAESAVAGTVGGAGMGTLGAAGDLAHAAPRKAWIGAGNLTQSGMDAVKNAGTAATEAVTPAWEGLKASVDAGIGYARGLVPEGVEMPQRAKDVAEFIKTGVEDQIASARTAYKSLMEAEDLPAEIKKQAKAWGGNLMDTTNRASLWAAEQARAAGEFAKDKAPEGLVNRARSILKPVTDMADTILNSESMEATKQFAGKTTDEIKRMTGENTAKFGTWAKEQGTKLYNRVDLSESQRKTLSEGLANASERAGQIKVASVAKAMAAKDKVLEGLNKIGEQAQKLVKKTDTKKSEDYAGFENTMAHEIAPILERDHPALMEDPKALVSVARNLRILSQAMIEGDKLKSGLLMVQLADHLGSDTAQEIMAKLGPLTTKPGSEEETAYFKQVNGLADEEKRGANLVSVLNKYNQDMTPRQNRQLAQLISDHVAGHTTKGMSPERAKFENDQFMKLMDEQFGGKAKNIMAAAEREFKARAKDTLLEGNELTEDEEGRTVRTKVGNDLGEKVALKESSYVGGGKQKNASIQAPFVGKDNYGNQSAAHRLMREIQEKDAGARTEFVTVSKDESLFDKIPAFKGFVTKTRNTFMKESYPALLKEAQAALKSHPQDYTQGLTAKELADGWAEEDIGKLVEAKKQSMREKGEGMIKVSRIDDANRISNDEANAMRMDQEFSNKEHPSRITVMSEDGKKAEHVFDATKVTGVMMKRLNRERSWTKEDDRNKMTLILRAFTEGVAQLSDAFGRVDLERADGTIDKDLIIWRTGDKAITLGDAMGVDKGVRSSKTTNSKGQETWYRREAGADVLEPSTVNEAMAEANRINRDLTDAEANREALVEEVAELTKEWQQSDKKVKPRELRAAERDLKYETRQIENLRKAQERVEARIQYLDNRASFEDGKVAAGKQSYAKDDEIHLAAAEYGEDNLTNRTNMDGTPSGSSLGSEGRRGVGNFIGSAARKKKQAILAAAKAERTTTPRPEATDRSDRIPKNPVRFDKDGNVIGVTPDPKSVAAKKAAFLEKAASGDKALIEEIGKSNDAKGLQRAADALNDAGVKGMALDAINARLGELVQNPDTAYGLQTKKYSLMGTLADPDEGPYESYHPQTNTAEFKEWYGDWTNGRTESQGSASESVPDAGGVREPVQGAKPVYSFDMDGHGPTGPGGYPMVFFHGTKGDVSFFKRSHAGQKDLGWLGRGTYLTTSPYIGERYAELKSRADGTKTGDDDQNVMPLYAAVRNPYVATQQTKDDLARADLDTIQRFTNMLKAKGHDGVILNFKDTQELVVFEPSNVKSATGNNGEFSKVNPNLNRSAQTANNPNRLTPKGKAQIRDYIRDVLGASVMVDFPNIPHAGEFGYDPQLGHDLISVSVHALNPMSVAYHESLHAFFKQLRKTGNSAITDVLEKAAQSPVVMAKLRSLLAGHPDALKQLNDPEERAAYMYQFWANGDLKVGEKATTLFGKIAEYIRKALGIWSNDERALHIMEYFSSGEYAQHMGQPNVVRAVLMDQGRNKAVDSLKGMSKSFMELGEAVFGAGSANLRDSGIPALAELADKIKLRGTDTGADQGYLPAARIARSEYMNRLSKVFTGNEAHMREALEALQTATVAVTPEARAIQTEVRAILDDVYKYLDKAGVKVNDLGLGKDYFPRQWDAHYLSTQEGKDAFFAMARKYPQWADPASTYRKLVGLDGSALPVVDRPGFDAKKERMLSFISHADAAPFMNKDLAQTLNSYVTQATRRAEWARRFQDDNTGLSAILSRARREGATREQLDQAKKFVAGVNGTLGDDLNPTLRRYMGNMIVYQNIRLLPLAIFSSIVDPMGVMVRGGTISDAWATLKRGIREIPKGLKGDTSNDEMTQLAQDLDVIDNAMLQASLGALYTQGVVSDTGRKINDAFFRFNLMEQFGRSMRVGATEAALKFMVKHANATASPHSARWMAELGLKAGDVQVVNGRMATSEADGLTPEQAARVKVAVNRWVDGAVLRPDAADKPVWMNDPHFMLISHLKQFVYSFQHTILERMLHEARHGNYTPALALSSYVPIMLAADMIKGVLQGGGDEPEWKRQWGAGDYLMNATERAGLFGVGQFGVEALHGNWGALTGPTVEQLGEGVQVLGGSRQFKTFALHSLPANSVYATAAREGRNDTFDNPE